jgi:hypothetical protein
MNAFPKLVEENYTKWEDCSLLPYLFMTTIILL